MNFEVYDTGHDITNLSSSGDAKPTVGFEPTAPNLQGSCSSQLSYVGSNNSNCLDGAANTSRVEAFGEAGFDDLRLATVSSAVSL